MHAVVVNATLNDFDRARQALTEQGIPQIKQAPGFVAGYWTRSGDNSGLSMVLFESEDAARAAAEQLRSQGPPDPEAVTIDNVEICEVVANA